MVEEGDPAPDFRLPGTDGGEIERYRLHDHVGDGVVVLAFYGFDFHPSCTRQLCAIRDLSWFDIADDVSAFAVSTDRAFSHRVFADEYGFDFVLLSDSDGAVSERYGALYEERDGHKRVSKRAVFVIDEGGSVVYRWVGDLEEQPDWSTVEEAVRETKDGSAVADSPE